MKRAPKKGNIISMRMSDEERAAVQELIDQKNTRASTLMREAFLLFKEQWETNRTQ
jgi:Mg/Co/Ni transporter MgtE